MSGYQQCSLAEEKWMKSIGKLSRHSNVRYFSVTEIVDRGKLTIQHHPTLDMPTNYTTKPLQGGKLLQFRKEILGNQNILWRLVVEVVVG